MIRLHLIDDGTLDTVIRCQECGDELRFTFPGHDGECAADNPASREDCDCYAMFVEECLEQAADEHECETFGESDLAMGDE